MAGTRPGVPTVAGLLRTVDQGGDITWGPEETVKGYTMHRNGQCLRRYPALRPPGGMPLGQAPYGLASTMETFWVLPLGSTYSRASPLVAPRIA